MPAVRPLFAASLVGKKWAEPKKQKQEALFARGRGMSRVVGGGQTTIDRMSV